MTDKVLIFDFGSQLTQLIARRIRELNVYCEILPFNKEVGFNAPEVKGVILSGSPFSVNDENALQFAVEDLPPNLPVLGICYGAQLIASHLGGKVQKSDKREYGRAHMQITKSSDKLWKDIPTDSVVWMSHADSIESLPTGGEILASTHDIPVAAFAIENDQQQIFGLQFHPEVTHSDYGKKILSNFVLGICECSGDWSTASYIDDTIADIRKTVGNKKVILGLSGGVDSSVAALLLHRAIGKQLHCIFINNGLLRLNEFEEVLKSYESLGLQINGVDASDQFLDALEGIEDPETKRKIIGNHFIEVFQEKGKKMQDVEFLAQGTIYPDVIESVSVHGPSAKIKSHHNVGGLPEKMNLKIVEPLRKLFKDEVRKVGAALELPDEILHRHPFPGPGLAIRILGPITRENVSMLQQADNIYISNLKAAGLYDKIWQAGAILLPVHSVGVMGDERTYEKVVALRAVNSFDGMTADWYDFSHQFLAKVSNDIINKVKGINRVVYDISSKPPATIEWE